jgi:ribosomal protein L17
MKDPYAKLASVLEKLQRRVEKLIQEQAETRALVEQMAEKLEQRPTGTVRTMRGVSQ